MLLGTVLKILADILRFYADSLSFLAMKFSKPDFT